MTMQEVLETRECDTDDGAELWVIGIVESDGWANDECVTPSRTVPPPGGAWALDRKWGRKGARRGGGDGVCAPIEACLGAAVAFAAAALRTPCR
eukprot:COSAG01_NODE_12137_length_1795_cov_1.484670_3_plen_94_part_00